MNMFNTIVVAVATLCATATAASTPLVWLDDGRSQQQQQQQQQRRAGKYKVSKKRNVQQQIKEKNLCQRPNVANAEVKCANEKTANTLPSYETTCTVTCADNYGILDHTNELVMSVNTVCLEDSVTRYHYDGQATENVFSQQCTPL